MSAALSLVGVTVALAASLPATLTQCSIAVRIVFHDPDVGVLV